MPNVTIKLPHQTYRQARIWAAQHDLSISKAFRIFLEQLPGLSAIKLRAAHAAALNGAAPPQVAVPARVQVTSQSDAALLASLLSQLAPKAPAKPAAPAAKAQTGPAAPRRKTR